MASLVSLTDGHQGVWCTPGRVPDDLVKSGLAFLMEIECLDGSGLALFMALRNLPRAADEQPLGEMDVRV